MTTKAQFTQPIEIWIRCANCRRQVFGRRVAIADTEIRCRGCWLAMAENDTAPKIDSGTVL